MCTGLEIAAVGAAIGAAGKGTADVVKAAKQKPLLGGIPPLINPFMGQEEPDILSRFLPTGREGRAFPLAQSFLEPQDPFLKMLQQGGLVMF